MEIIYLSCRYTVTTRMVCIKMGSDENHFNVSLIVRDKVTRPCPQITTFEEKGEPKRYRTEVLPLTSLSPYSQAKPALSGEFKDRVSSFVVTLPSLQVSLQVSKSKFFIHATSVLAQFNPHLTGWFDYLLPSQFLTDVLLLFDCQCSFYGLRSSVADV